MLRASQSRSFSVQATDGACIAQPPSHPAVNRNGQAPTVETAPCAVGEEIAISTRMNSFVQEIFDLFNLRQITAAMVFNQDDYLARTTL